MRPSLYKRLMEHLDSGLYNDEGMLEESPEEIFERLVEEVGERTYEDVSREEMCRAIQGWLERNQ